MKDILDQDTQSIITYIRNRFSNYQPQTIKRVYIPKDKLKPNGKQRPLGIPTMEERLIQQCILQVLEPIAEAKFVHQSFGFRPHRSVHHAHARVKNLLDTSEMNYVVDMDIKAFFDNVSHSKLIKQLYTLGIHDKALLTIIKRMLKAGIVEPKFPDHDNQGITIPDKGTPQGGILSPLLANIVLNEFDHWITSQWEEFKTKNEFKGNASQSNKTKSLRKYSKLKQLYYVRYADDFRIFTTDHQQAEKIYHVVTMWLKERLKLEVSEEKSSIINLKNKNMKFLGIQYKLVENPKRKQHKLKKKSIEWVSHTSVTEDTFKKMKSEIRQRIIAIKYTFKHEERIKAIMNYNAYIRGLNFYSITSKWSQTSSRLTWNTRNVRYNRLKRIFRTRKYSRDKSVEVGEFAKKRDRISVNKIELLTPSDIKHQDIFMINPLINKYTKEGRALVHDERKSDISNLFKYFEEHIEVRETVEYNVNKIAALSRQQGLCAITGQPLKIGLINVHHKKLIKDGGTNSTINLYLLNIYAHQMIHTIDKTRIKAQYQLLTSSLKEPLRPKAFLEKLNKFREAIKNEKLKLNDILQA